MPQPSELAAVVSSKCQVVIPAGVRQVLGLTQGSVLRFVVAGDTVQLLPATGDIRRLKGCLARAGAPAAPVSVEAMNAAIAARRAQAGRA